MTTTTTVAPTCRGFYDRKKLFWKEVEDTVLVAACAPPGGGRQEMTPRWGAALRWHLARHLALHFAPGFYLG